MKSIFFLLAAATTFAQTAKQCADLSKFQMPGATIEITRAEIVPAGQTPGGRGGRGPAGPMLPAHCRVNGIVDKRTGADGKTYGIRFAVALPENWNGDFLQQGGGGLNGTVGEPIGNQAVGDKPALARGFAVASSDTGHQSSGGGFDGSFMQDQQAALDFEFVAIGRLTVLAKQIIAAYYGKPPAHSYYVGCSTGGREAMLMSQRYPLYFDGIVVGSPAMRTGHSNLATRTVTVALNSVAPKDASGKPGPALTDSEKKAFIAKLLDACDARDGVKDGMIFDPAGCNFRPRDLQCQGAKADGCLSPEQVAAIDISNSMPPGGQGLNRKDPTVIKLMNQQKQMILSMGQFLGEEVMHVMRSMDRMELSIQVDGRFKTVSCPGRERTNEGRASPVNIRRPVRWISGLDCFSWETL